LGHFNTPTAGGFVALHGKGVGNQGFTVLRGPIPADQKYANNFNFSQRLPRWR